MAESDYQERSEQPTQAKREEAWRLGKIPKSRDLTLALSLLGGFAGICLFGPGLLRQGCASFRWFLSSTSTDPSAWTAERLPELARLCATAILWGILPTALLCTGMSLASNVLQGGFQIRAESIQPSLARLNPVEGVRRLLGLRSLGRGLFAAAKFVLVGLLGAALLASSWEAFLPAASGIRNWEVCLERLAADGLKISLGLVSLAVLDYLFQFWQHERDLRMTRAELKEEVSRLEGNLEVKGRQRKARRRLLGRRRNCDSSEAGGVSLARKSRGTASRGREGDLS